MGADNSYILYSDTTGRQRVEGREECTRWDLSVFSCSPQPGCWAPNLLEREERGRWPGALGEGLCKLSWNPFLEPLPPQLGWP